MAGIGQYQGNPLEEDNAIRLFTNANQRLRHIHDALWKEETHYTWLVYILIAGVVWILGSDIDEIWGGILAISLSLVGIFVCLIGYYVLIRERYFFEQAMESWKKYANELGIAELELIRDRLPGPNITDCFKATLIVPIFVFVALIIAAAFSFC